MDTSEDTQRTNDLIERISSMRRRIFDLKSKLQLEKDYITQHKLTIQETQSQANWSPQMKKPSYAHPYRPWTSHSIANFPEYSNLSKEQDNKTLIFPLPEKGLRDIEEKCDTELVKLQRYIDSIKELRMYWKNAIDANKSEGLTKISKNTPSEEPRRVIETVPKCLRS